MLKIRLQRVGRKNDPSFRVVVLESTEGPKSGNHVDEIGFYNAVTKQKNMDTEKARLWLSKGAQPSDTVYNMLVTEGVIDGKKRNVLPSKSPIVKEAASVASEASSASIALEDGSVPSTEAKEASEAVAEAPDLPAEASVQTEASSQGEALVKEEA
ncbi:MAG TPA: 30S ribosomal protein S16, partial [Candidatus Paceibacterota bacterium]|nr:30S ribosomal protein S16 [Candidatus Paceibacterota bacterium]